MSRKPQPWEQPGPSTAGLQEVDRALARFHKSDHRQATDDDRPPPSTFPNTRASREALRLNRAMGGSE